MSKVSKVLRLKRIRSVKFNGCFPHESVKIVAKLAAFLMVF